ncbi:uncharacterized protein HKW66_Vig0104310 [Vigna angularis]|uniref:Uncharacterized protein n=1 Tax=Phaseolus angularis TaxID=3914 RepID=A0A8T0KJ37_PHAAN|nr:uncharacterized protein HKW66_Vig0104310 [Vigna angularis]
MVKLASARDFRTYGPGLAKNRFEYINAGLYLIATILLLSGITAQLSSEARSGLVLIFVAFGFIFLLNLHDLLAHLAGIDFQLHLMTFDLQLAFVEFAVPVVQMLGALLFFVGEEKGYGHFEPAKHALNMLVAGPVLWVIGSIHNSCQIYEKADGHGSTWIWLGIFGSLMLLIGGLTNLIKVFKMQQMNGIRLEKLRGGAHERLVSSREGHVPLIIERQSLSHEPQETKVTLPIPTPAPASTPYKDVLIGSAK